MRYTPGVKSERTSETYTRAEIRRILGINANRLLAWERSGLADPKDDYSFADLIALRTLQRLRENGIPNRRISEALTELRIRLSHVTSPLDELKIVSDGRRIAIQLPGERVEAITGQVLFDFDADSLRSVATMEVTQVAGPPDSGGGEDYWFQQAQDLEKSGAPVEEVIEAYRKVIDCNPSAAGAWVNIGTLQFRQGRLPLAESSYQSALRAHPEYAVAHYNLGNVCDATDRLQEAIHHYEQALRLSGDYADAHYNIALAYGKRRSFSDAIRHWDRYLELDSSSPWSAVARRNRERLAGMVSADKSAAGGSLRKPLRESSD